MRNEKTSRGIGQDMERDSRRGAEAQRVAAHSENTASSFYSFLDMITRKIIRGRRAI
jgi:hypothetical protein